MCVKHQSLAAHPALFQPQSSVIKAGHFFFLEHSSSASEIFYPSPEEKSIIIMKFFFFFLEESLKLNIKHFFNIPEEYEAALIL